MIVNNFITGKEEFRLVYQNRPHTHPSQGIACNPSNKAILLPPLISMLAHANIGFAYIRRFYQVSSYSWAIIITAV